MRRPMPFASLCALGLALSLALSAGCRRGHGEHAGGKPAEGGRVTRGKEPEAERTLVTLWALERGNHSRSGYAVATLHAKKASKGGATLAVEVENCLETAPDWKASAFSAWANAALLVGDPLGDLSFELRAVGPLDGPSAGGAIAVAMLSAITGTPLELPERPGETVMTESGHQRSSRLEPALCGVASPDGTIGAAQSLARKLRECPRALRTLLLVPEGQRRAWDSDSEPADWVDLVTLGQTEEVEVAEVGTLAQAFESFTATPLPWPKGAKATERKAASGEPLMAAAKRRIARTGDDLGRAEKATPEELDRCREKGLFDLRAAQTTYDLAYSLLADADYGAALEVAGEVQRDTLVGIRATRALRAWDEGEREPERLAEAAKAQRPDRGPIEGFAGALHQALTEAGANLEEPTVGDALALGDTLAQGLAAAALLRREEAGFAAALAGAEGEASAMAALRQMLWLDAWAETESTIARDCALVGLGQTGSALAKGAFDPWTARLEAAARANLDYIEGRVLPERARDVRMQPDAFRRWLLTWDGDLAACEGRIAALDTLEALMGKEGRLPEIARNGLAREAFALSGVLVARYYCLDTRFDPASRQAAPTNLTSLNPMLELARERAESLVAEAREAGAPVASARSLLALADAAKRRFPSDPVRKSDALGALWRASLSARLATLLAVPEEKPKPKSSSASKSSKSAKEGAAAKKEAPAEKKSGH